jgi:hypothetical protein
MKGASPRLFILAAAVLLLASAAPAAGPFQFYSITPCRLVDTRNPAGPSGGPILAGDTVRSFPITGTCGIPAGAQAAVLNVVIVGPSGGGNLRVWPYNTTMPLVATINFDPLEPAIANGAIVPLSADPSLQVSVYPAMGAGQTTHLVIDATGYFQ